MVVNKKMQWADRIRQRTAGAGADVMSIAIALREGKYLALDRAVARLKQHLAEIDNVANELMYDGQQEFLRTEAGQNYAEEMDRVAEEIDEQQRNWERGQR